MKLFQNLHIITNMISYSNEHKLPELESIRGYASLSVVISHAMATILPLNKDSNMLNILIHLIFNENSAVILFFVLSGFVLSVQIGQLSGNNLTMQFLIRRFFRLIPIIYISCIFAFLLRIYLKHPEGNYKNLLDSILFINPSINPPLWSVFVEVYCSFIFPLIFFLSRKNYLMRIFLFIVFLFFYTTTLQIPSWLRYFFMFYIGHLLYLYYFELNLKYFKFIYLFTFILASLLYSIPSVIYQVKEISGGEWMHYSLLSSTVLIFLVIKSHELKKFVMNKYLYFLGKISFSLYLIHFPIIMVVNDTFLQVIHNQILNAFIATLLSIFIFFYIEAPINNVGKNIFIKYKNLK